MAGSCTRISRQGLGQFSSLIKKPAAAGFHRDQAEEVGSPLASAAAFSALRRQVMRKKSSHSIRSERPQCSWWRPIARLDQARILSLVDAFVLLPFHCVRSANAVSWYSIAAACWWRCSPERPVESSQPLLRFAIDGSGYILIASLVAGKPCCKEDPGQC